MSVDLRACAPAESGKHADGFAGERCHCLPVQAVIGTSPGAEHVTADARAVNDVGRVGRAHGDDAAYRRAAVQRRRRAVQDFDGLNQAGIDEVPRGVRKTAGVELVGQRHAVHEDGDPVAANASNIDALGAEPRAGRLVVDARHVAKHVADGRGELGVELGPGQDRDARRDFSHRAFVLVSHDDDLLDRAFGTRIRGRRQGRRSDHGQQGDRGEGDGIWIHRVSEQSGGLLIRIVRVCLAASMI